MELEGIIIKIEDKIRNIYYDMVDGKNRLFFNGTNEDIINNFIDKFYFIDLINVIVSKVGNIRNLGDLLPRFIFIYRFILKVENNLKNYRFENLSIFDDFINEEVRNRNLFYVIDGLDFFIYSFNQEYHFYSEFLQRFKKNHHYCSPVVNQQMDNIYTNIYNNMFNQNIEINEAEVSTNLSNKLYLLSNIKDTFVDFKRYYSENVIDIFNKYGLLEQSINAPHRTPTFYLDYIKEIKYRVHEGMCKKYPIDEDSEYHENQNVYDTLFFDSMISLFLFYVKPYVLDNIKDRCIEEFMKDKYYITRYGQIIDYTGDCTNNLPPYIGDYSSGKEFGEAFLGYFGVSYFKRTKYSVGKFKRFLKEPNDHIIAVKPISVETTKVKLANEPLERNSEGKTTEVNSSGIYHLNDKYWCTEKIFCRRRKWCIRPRFIDDFNYYDEDDYGCACPRVYYFHRR